MIYVHVVQVRNIKNVVAEKNKVDPLFLNSL